MIGHCGVRTSESFEDAALIPHSRKHGNERPRTEVVHRMGIGSYDKGETGEEFNDRVRAFEIIADMIDISMQVAQSQSF